MNTCTGSVENIAIYIWFIAVYQLLNTKSELSSGLVEGNLHRRLLGVNWWDVKGGCNDK